MKAISTRFPYIYHMVCIFNEKKVLQLTKLTKQKLNLHHAQVQIVDMDHKNIAKLKFLLLLVKVLNFKYSNVATQTGNSFNQN